ncbi:hypothetical protein GCM10010236_10670 [Streptomyces eurythermus]|nr:hypothetical protein GCM10010236_10670 [Streptomyces eurythermus]
MAEQLDRLYSLVGQKRVELGIIPFDAQLHRTAPHAFWVYDRRLVIPPCSGAAFTRTRSSWRAKSRSKPSSRPKTRRR